jgi:predicted dehydrogenase
VTRRDFVRASAAALAAAPLAAPLFGAPLAAPLGRGMGAGDGRAFLRIGLVGCGGRGSGAALEALRADERTVLHAMADVFPARIESSLRSVSDGLSPAEDDGAAELPPDRPLHPRCEVPPERRFAGFDAYERLIASGVDVVLLATPPGFRPWHLAAAVGAGKHVFCEKPVAVDSPGVRSVLASAALAREKGLTIVSGFCWRHHAAKRAAIAELRAGRIGALRAISTTYNTGPLGRHEREAAWSDWEFQLRNWQHFDFLSGDHLVEQAVHSIDKMIWIAGELPERAVAVGGRCAREGESSGNIFDHFAVHYDFPSGVRGFHMSRQIANASNDNSDLALGATGALAMDWDRDEITGSDPWRFEGERGDMYQAEQDAFFASIHSGEARNDGESMAHSTLAAILGREAAYTGRTVTWQEVLESPTQLMPPPDQWRWGSHAANAVPIPGRTRG